MKYLNLISLMSAVSFCIDCVDKAVPNFKPEGCKIGFRKAGLSETLIVHCRILISTMEEKCAFLAGADVPFLNEDGTVGTINILTAAKDGLIGRLTCGQKGSWGKQSSQTEQYDSCKPAKVVNNTWRFNTSTAYLDTSGSFADCAIWNDFIENADNYHIIFVSCDPEKAAFIFTKDEWSLSDLDYSGGEDGTTEVQLRSFSADVSQLKPPCQCPFKIYDDFIAVL